MVEEFLVLVALGVGAGHVGGLVVRVAAVEHALVVVGPRDAGELHLEWNTCTETVQLGSSFQPNVQHYKTRRGRPR